MTSSNGARRRDVLVDTGPLVALFDPADTSHERCAEVVRPLRAPAWTCWPVITEAAYLLRRYPAGVERMLGMLRGELLQIAPLTAADVPLVARYLTRYADLKLQLADACLAHLADREGYRTVFTLDRRDFAAVRLVDGAALAVIPE